MQNSGVQSLAEEFISVAGKWGMTANEKGLALLGN
jgi:hypothetical protein